MSDYSKGYLDGYRAARNGEPDPDRLEPGVRIPTHTWRCDDLDCAEPRATHACTVPVFGGELRVAPEHIETLTLVQPEPEPGPGSAMRPTGQDEVRTMSATGGQKGDKLARFDLIPAGPLWLVAELYGIGAQKYDDRNWEKGYPWHLSYAAAQRHMTAFWRGEDIDAHTDRCPADCKVHTGLPHPVCAIFHMLALVEFMTTHTEYDDRPRPPQAS